ncbi:MAG: hypothetical protein NVSMB9_10980 [Isosphaeraceae bacterium]
MSLFSRILHAVHSWRRRGGPKASRHAGVSLEQLDHRQLLSVNFTGNVATDFPAASKPGVVILTDNPSVRHPTISPDIAPIVKVSGFDIQGMRVSYTPADDTLSIGIEQPLSQQPDHPGPVIAGDSDNNGNDGTVSPAVAAIKGKGFRDFADFGGSEFMQAFLDLKGTGYADITAGYGNNDARSPKQYQVARAIVNKAAPPTAPDFGAELTRNEGNVYKVNSPSHPNLEFSITHFAELYTAETGKPLTPDTVIQLGAAAGSGDDLGIGEAFYPEQPVRIGDATSIVAPPPTCPPVSPPIAVNFHANSHINTAHDTRIRVNVLGSSGFDVQKIDPNSVTLGGAHPVFSFHRFINKDQWPDATFVFRGTDVHLPRGFTNATVNGKLADGTSFSSSVRVFNRDRSFYGTRQNLVQQQREANRDARRNGFVILPGGSPIAPQPTPRHPAHSTAGGPRAIRVPRHHSMTHDAALAKVSVPRPRRIASPSSSPVRSSHAPVVSIKRREPVVIGQGSAQTAHRVPARLQSSLDRYVRSVGAVEVGTGRVLSGGAR